MLFIFYIYVVLEKVRKINCQGGNRTHRVRVSGPALYHWATWYLGSIAPGQLIIPTFLILHYWHRQNKIRIFIFCIVRIPIQYLGQTILSTIVSFYRCLEHCIIFLQVLNVDGRDVVTALLRAGNGSYSKRSFCLSISLCLLL